MLNLAASMWLFVVWGLWASVWTRDRAAASGHSFSLAFLTLLFLALPFLLPARFNSVLLGAGSSEKASHGPPAAKGRGALRSVTRLPP